MKIYLFLPDFRGLVKNTAFTFDDINHCVFYIENSEKIIFYKPIGSILYCVEITKKLLPEGSISLEFYFVHCNPIIAYQNKKSIAFMTS